MSTSNDALTVFPLSPSHLIRGAYWNKLHFMAIILKDR